MRGCGRAILAVLAGLAVAGPALADQEASNVAHVAAGPYGRCYAKSVPRHVYDPEDGPRQQGETRVYRVGETDDMLIDVYDWFSQQLFLLCAPGDNTVVVRVGPWQRGHDPRAEHLALAFYRGGTLLARYSTLDIAGEQRASGGSISQFQNVSPSVSHYTVFESWPEMVRITAVDGVVYSERWVIRATTVDGRILTFDMATGALR